MEQHIKKCEKCLKTKVNHVEPTQEDIVVSYPMELVHLDFMSIPSRSDKNINILVVTDHFTRLGQAFVIPTLTASVVAKVLWEKFFMYYGIPEKILSDQDRDYENSLIVELVKLAGVKRLRTTSYRPQTDGKSEKFNFTLIEMLKTLPSEGKYNWQDHVNTLVHAYNCMDSTVTKFSPHYLMFGREPNLPIDLEFGVRTSDLVPTSTDNYVRKLQKRLAWAFRKAQKVNLKENKKSQKNQDKRLGALN